MSPFSFSFVRHIPVTASLLLLNVLAFAGMALHQESILLNRPDDFIFLLNTGALFNPFVVDGDFWRLFTSMFMHWGIVHLGVNMYALHGLGSVLEPSLGSKRFAAVYLITGLVAGLGSLMLNSYVVSAGASGAIFGLYGYLVLRQVFAYVADRRALTGVLINFVIFVAINYFIARQVNVDTVAHVAGGLCGALVGLLHAVGWFTAVAQLATALVLLPVLVLLLPRDQLAYFDYFQEVVKVENRLLAVNNQLLTDRQRADSLRLLLPDYTQVRDHLDSLDGVPSAVAGDTAILRRYLDYRLKMLHYRVMFSDTESYVYLDSVETVDVLLDSLPRLAHNLNFQRTGPASAASEEAGDSVPAGEPVKVYYDSGWRETTDVDAAHYYRLGTRDSLDRWQGRVEDYYIDGHLQMKGSYVDNKHHGVFRYYNKNGGYESLGRYDDDRATGKWESYFPNGQLKSEIYYGNGSFTRSVFDSTGRQQVRDGEGREVNHHANGVVAEEGEYRNGRREGDWLGYYENGKPHFREYYRDGLLIRGESRTPEGERVVYDQLSIFPYPEMGMERYREYLAGEVAKLPPSFLSKKGIVRLTFTVDAAGNLFDFVVREGLCAECDQEAIRMVREGPAWRPGVLHGHAKSTSTGFVDVAF